MLERAAGCLENAGRRFFRDSNGAIPRRRTLSSHFWQYNAASPEFPQWFLVFLQTSNNRAPHALSCAPSAARADNDAGTPVLDFLYPPQTREYAASCLLHSPRRFVPRRKKKAVPNFSRSYTSEATRGQQGVDGREPLSDVSQEPDRETLKKAARATLIDLLNSRVQVDYGKVWNYYGKAGYPLDLNSAVLAYMSSSEYVLDQKRAKRLFDAISVDSRSAEDYMHIIKSRLLVDTALEIKNICKEAIARDVGGLCWGLTFAYFLNEMQWAHVQDMWDSRPQPLEDDPLRPAVPHIDFSSFSEKLLALATHLQGKEDKRPLSQLAGVLLGYVFKSSKLVGAISTESILLLLRKYNELGILTPDHYFDLIQTLRLTGTRQAFIRSIVVYRNFRWRMERETPPRKILSLMLESLASYEITSGVQYLLDEFTHFYGKPSLEAYKNAMIAYSRTGEAESVHLTFEKFLRDHGKPSSRRLLTPLLYVHARVGNVPETRRQFQRIPDEFGLELNTACWNILLTAYTNADDLSGTLSTLDEMVAKGVGLDSHTFGTVMGFCANRGDIDAVHHLLAVAKQRNVQITTPMIDTVVEAYCNNKRFDLAESMAEMSLNLNIKGSRLRMWNMLLWNHAFRMDLEAIARIRARMDTAGLRPDGMTYAALMLSLALAGEPDSARRILRTLHRSHRIYATEFHYAIVLYGFVRARNRDMVHIIFEEIKTRFSRPGLSSRLLVLKNQLQRDLQLTKYATKEEFLASSMRLENAEKFLADTIADFDLGSFAAKLPSPGTGKHSLRQAFPAMYYEYMITAYGARGAVEKVQDLLDEYADRKKILDHSENPHESAPIRLLAALMLTYLKAEQYEKVQECWDMAFPRAVKMASRPDIEQWLSSSQIPPALGDEPPRPSLPEGVPGAADRLLLSSPTLEPDFLEKMVSILPSYRFMLSRCLSLYMRSLAYRNEYSRIPQVLAKVENAGFSLTSFNWATYVQLMASSEKPSDQVEAFVTFEKKFMPNFSGWKYLRRGFGVRPTGAPETIDAMESTTFWKKPGLLGRAGRRYWRKIQPDFMQPTYVSMVYLASSLLGFRERSIYDGGAEVTSLYDAAPLTIGAIADMPYLREKFQGVLLRRREEQGDKPKDVDGREPFVWTGGILGVGGRTRAHVDAEAQARFDEEIRQAQVSSEEQALSSTDAEPVPSVDSKVNDLLDNHLQDVPTPSHKTIDYPDEFDLEAETILSSERGPLIQAEEELDSDEHSGSADGTGPELSTLIDRQSSNNADTSEAKRQSEPGEADQAMEDTPENNPE